MDPNSFSALANTVSGHQFSAQIIFVTEIQRRRNEPGI